MRERDDWSLPRILLHLEGLAIALFAVAAYAHLVGDWLAFLVLILAPDLGMLGYLVNTRLGSWTYDALHFLALPLALIALGWAAGWLAGVALGLIWVAHIGGDRFVGYGLKYPTAFKDTHLARV
jgi:hypothetical protein